MRFLLLINWTTFAYLRQFIAQRVLFNRMNISTDCRVSELDYAISNIRCDVVDTTESPSNITEVISVFN
jgi:hypothetical protein